MSDLNDWLLDEGPVERDVTVGDKTVKVYFRRISAGERAKILKGLKIQHRGGESNVEIDLFENEKQGHMLVYYSVCKADGSRYFARLEDVEKADARKIKALSDVAQEVNREPDEPGKS